jgi:Spy/CpxP family protein refolding chaperone
LKFSGLKAGGLLVAAIVVLLPLSLAAQQSGSAGTKSGPATRTGPAHQVPCWKQAGIPQSVMEQHHSIEQSIHAQMAEVCSDGTLTSQQKLERIREIRKAGHEQMEGLLTGDQRSKLESCRTSRNAAHAGHPGNGPCAEMTAKPAGETPSQ